jgi:hypothetical protein
MAEVVICRRCGYQQLAPQPLLGRYSAAIVCPRCMGIVVRELGELAGPDERADPEEWGMGWH